MKKLTSRVIFIISFITLIISLKLFWNLGVFVDAYGLSPVNVNGSLFWLYMNWFRLLLTFMVVVISGLNSFNLVPHKDRH